MRHRPRHQETPSSPFDAVLSILGRPKNEAAALDVKDRKADSSVLDRLASLHMAIAEKLAPDAASNPETAEAFLGAAREARACVLAKHQVTTDEHGGGRENNVIVRIEHANVVPSDNFDEMNASADVDVAVSTGRPSS